MTPLSEQEKREIIKLIEAGESLPEKWRRRLFPSTSGTAEKIGKEYRLVYEGKARREEVLAQTPAAPWQLVRRFCEKHPHADGIWHNLLVWGDNLFALRELLADQQGRDRFGTRGKIKLVYIDPPFATRQDFMKDKEKAYRDKVLGAQFIEFLRKRVILLGELLADGGSIYLHLDWKKGHYIKAVLDEIFDETNFRNHIAWKRSAIATNVKTQWRNSHDYLLFYSKNGKHAFLPQFGKYTESSLKHFSYRDERGAFQPVPLLGSGKTKGLTGQAWRGIDPNSLGKNGMHWLKRPSVLDELDKQGLIYWPKEGGNSTLKVLPGRSKRSLRVRLLG